MSNAERIAKLRAEADALEAADRVFETLPEEHRLAITLHKMLCHWNHTDGCGWEYEALPVPAGWVGPRPADWNGHAHSRYLQKALKVQHICKEHGIDTDVAITVLQAAQE